MTQHRHGTPVVKIDYFSSAGGKTARRSVEEFTAASSSELVVQDYAAEATMDNQPSFTFVIDKTKLPELIHKIINPVSYTHLTLPTSDLV